LKPQAGDAGDEAERGGHAVTRRSRGDPDHDVRNERDRVLLQAFVLDLDAADRDRFCDRNALHCALSFFGGADIFRARRQRARE
jgi:hypothetical protein